MKQTYRRGRIQPSSLPSPPRKALAETTGLWTTFRFRPCPNQVHLFCRDLEACSLRLTVASHPSANEMETPLIVIAIRRNSCLADCHGTFRLFPLFQRFPFRVKALDNRLDRLTS